MRRKPLVRVPRRLIHKPVKVKWLDHEGHGPQWTPVATIPENPAEFTSVGYLLKVTKGAIVLGSTLDEPKTTTGDVTVLVRSCVTSRQPM